MAPNVGQIMSFLNAGKGIRWTSTITGDALQQLLSKADDEVSRALRTALSKAKNPTVEVAAKASNQGYTVAGMLIKDGEELIGKGAISVTDFNRSGEYWKTKFSLFGDKVRVGGSFHCDKPLDVDDVVINMANRKGSLSMEGVSNANRVYLQADSKEVLEQIKPGSYDAFLGNVNQKMTKFWDGFRAWTTGEGSFGWWKTDKIAKFEKLKETAGPNKFQKFKTSAWKLKDRKIADFDLEAIRKNFKLSDVSLNEASKKADDAAAETGRIYDAIVNRIKVLETAESKTLVNKERDLAWATKRAQELGIDISDIVKNG